MAPIARSATARSAQKLKDGSFSFGAIEHRPVTAEANATETILSDNCPLMALSRHSHFAIKCPLMTQSGRYELSPATTGKSAATALTTT